MYVYGVQVGASDKWFSDPADASCTKQSKHSKLSNSSLLRLVTIFIILLILYSASGSPVEAVRATTDQPTLKKLFFPILYG